MPTYSVARGYEIPGDVRPLILGQKADTVDQVQLDPRNFNKHGIICGATGTGKTSTAQMIAEQLSGMGIPSLIADAKGDLTAMALPAANSESTAERARTIGHAWTPTAVPVEYLSLGETGIGTAVRASVGSLGPELLGRMLRLSPDQSTAFQMAFIYAEKYGIHLSSVQDLIDVLTIIRETGTGGVTKPVVDRALGKLIVFGHRNADFFGAPHFDVHDLLRVTDSGWGIVNMLDVSSLRDKPEMFTTFVLWTLRMLERTLPEVGDSELKLVVFFDEAHRLFRDASAEFLKVVEDTIKVIRSKGVGVFFISQSASDIPDPILSQCANRIQHALRSYTQGQMRTLKQTAATFPRSQYNTVEVLQTLRTGQALVCVMDETGAPTPPAVTTIRSPRSSQGRLDDETRATLVLASPINQKYYEAALELANAKLVQAEPEPVFTPSSPDTEATVEMPPVQKEENSE